MIYDAFGFSNYPKMWFYLQLKIVFTLSFFGLVKSLSCFCVVFKVLRTCPQAFSERVTSPTQGCPKNQVLRTQVIG